MLLGSRAGANRLSVSNAPFDLAKVLREAATLFRPLSDKHVLVTDLPGDLPWAQGDAAATDSIVSQLLENAFKYSPDGGTVTITARCLGRRPQFNGGDAGVAGNSAGGGESADRSGGSGEGAGRLAGREGAGRLAGGEGAGRLAGGDGAGRLAGGEIEVTVSDEGIGIAPEDLERVFERFVQGDAGDRRRFGGIGLGLYIVRQLARAQGGDVSAAVRPGGGSVLRLALPLAQIPEEEPSKRAQKPKPAKSAAPPADAPTMISDAGTADAGVDVQGPDNPQA